MQALLAGYLKGFFDLTLDDYRATAATLALFALTYAMREGLDAASGSGDLTLAMFAGGVLGLLIGVISLWLRAKSGSLLPAVVDAMAAVVHSGWVIRALSGRGPLALAGSDERGAQDHAR